MVTIVDIRSGSIGGISGGSIGIIDQPIGIHGTVDIQSDITIGTVNIAGTLTVNVNSGSIGIFSGSITTVSNVLTLGTLNNVVSLGTLSTTSYVATLGTIDSLTRAGSIGDLAHLTSGSVGILGGTVGISSGSITTVSTVTTLSSLTSGSVGILGGTVGISSGSITTVTDIFRLGSVGNLGTVDSLTRVGSIGDLAHLTSGSVGILGGTIGQINNVGSLTTVSSVTSGSIGILSIAASTTLPVVTTVSSLTSGSVGILGGTVGISSGSITTVSSLTSGSIGILEFNSAALLPNITKMGTLDYVSRIGTIAEMPSSAGSATEPGGRIQIFTAPTMLFAANSSRLYAGMQFESVVGGGDGTIYFRFGDNADGSAFRLERGQRYEINQLNLWRGTITGAGRSSSGFGTYNVHVVEWSK